MSPLDSPFEEADRLIQSLAGKVKVILVDFHAEATSEKQAMGWHLDGRVSAVVGTHTHVPTADARVLPAGTAFITDVGMTGPYESIIGFRVDRVLRLDPEAVRREGAVLDRERFDRVAAAVREHS